MITGLTTFYLTCCGDFLLALFFLSVVSDLPTLLIEPPAWQSAPSLRGRAIVSSPSLVRRC
jgi:hypothetical protein